MPKCTFFVPTNKNALTWNLSASQVRCKKTHESLGENTEADSFNSTDFDETNFFQRYLATYKNNLKLVVVDLGN